jgi:Ankyrin repeats (3 copies)
MSLSHQGNVRLRNLAAQFKHHYQRLTPSEKAPFAKKMFDAWRDDTAPRGRVLRKVGLAWQELAEEAAVRVVMAILRRGDKSRGAGGSTRSSNSSTHHGAGQSARSARSATSNSLGRVDDGQGNVKEISGPESKRQKLAHHNEVEGQSSTRAGGVVLHRATDDWQSSNGDALRRAIGQKEPLRVLRAILSTDPDSIKRRDDNGRVPLHVAACSDSPLDVVRVLVNQWEGALRVPDKHGELPLHAAVGLERGIVRLSVVRYLVDKYEPALRVRDEDGRLPLHVAADNGAPLEVIHVLVNKWEQAVQEPDKYGKVPLDVAADRGRSDVVRYLLDKWDPAVQVREFSMEGSVENENERPARLQRPARPETEPANPESDSSSFLNESKVAAVCQQEPDRMSLEGGTTKYGQACPSTQSYRSSPEPDRTRLAPLLHGLHEPQERGLVAADGSEDGMEAVSFVNEPSPSRHQHVGEVACAEPGEDQSQPSKPGECNKPESTDVLFGRGSKLLQRAGFCCSRSPRWSCSVSLTR